jgi:nucleoside-diphosphate-sugar epimerase
VFNVGGPFLNKEYAIGSLIRAALFEPEIVVRARRETSRSFAFVGDIISAGFAVMLGLAPEVAKPYDTAGLEVIEVGDLANRVRAVLGRAEKPIIRASIDDLTADYYAGEGGYFQTIARSAGFSLMDLDTQIRLTADYIIESSR